MRPTAFAIKVLKVKYSLRATPLKIVFISGIPDPMLEGATICTNPEENTTRNTGSRIQLKYCANACEVKSRYSQRRAAK